MDGNSHDVAEERDRERDEHLAAMGIQAGRVSKCEVTTRLDATIARIAQAGHRSEASKR